MNRMSRVCWPKGLRKQAYAVDVETDGQAACIVANE